MSIFAIHGTFFSSEDDVHLALVPDYEGEGLITRLDLSHVFSGHFGVICGDDDGLEADGIMCDHYGPSELSVHIHDEDVLKFTKRYTNDREYWYRFSLKREKDNMWSGTWESMRDNTSGKVLCQVNEMASKDFVCRDVPELSEAS